MKESNGCAGQPQQHRPERHSPKGQKYDKAEINELEVLRRRLLPRKRSKKVVAIFQYYNISLLPYSFVISKQNIMMTLIIIPTLFRSGGQTKQCTILRRIIMRRARMTQINISSKRCYNDTLTVGRALRYWDDLQQFSHTIYTTKHTTKGQRSSKSHQQWSCGISFKHLRGAGLDIIMLLQHE